MSLIFCWMKMLVIFILDQNVSKFLLDQNVSNFSLYQNVCNFFVEIKYQYVSIRLIYYVPNFVSFKSKI